jgi:hypothetical protein
MSRTISADYPNGITLTNPGDSPVDVAAGATITNGTGVGLGSSTAYYWSITNSPGAIIGGYNFGVSIASAATVVNQGDISASQTTGPGYSYAAGVFTALSAGVYVAGGGVSNATNATITGGPIGVDLGGLGSVVNAGAISQSVAGGFGIVLADSGGVTNQTGGNITASRFAVIAFGSLTLDNQQGATITSAYRGIESTSGTGTAINQGAIIATTNVAVALFSGGSVTNLTGGLISGGLDGVYIATDPGTVTNQAVITGVTAAGIFMSAGGSVTNQQGGTITGGQDAVVLVGGSVANQQGGFIDGGQNGILIETTQGTVTNQGSVAGTTGVGIYLSAGGNVTNQTGGVISAGETGVYDKANQSTVTNQGTITGTGGVGVFLDAGGAVTNQANSTIAGGQDGVAAQLGSLYVANQGLIESVYPFVSGTNAIGAILLIDGGSVSNGSSGKISGSSYGVFIETAPGTVTNAGYIISSRDAGGAAVFLTDGGSVNNETSATIASQSYGVLISNAAGTVTNDGVILDNLVGGGAGVALLAGGSVTNTHNGNIDAGYLGVQIGQFNPTVAAPGAAPAGTIINYGGIYSSANGSAGAAVWMVGPGLVVNKSGGIIAGDVNGTIANGPLKGTAAGPFGIVAYYQTTVINYGSIGGSHYAFDASNKNPATSVGNRIELSPTASFGGEVKGAANAASASLSTLELMSGASVGTINNFGTAVLSLGTSSGYVNFGNVTIDNGARWNLQGTVAAATVVGFDAGGTGALTFADPSLMQGTITGFGTHETVSLAGITDTTGVSLSATGNVLTVEGTGLTLQFDPTQSFAGDNFSYQVAGGETNITVSCFVTGTSIQTAQGPVRVEHLAPGMHVVTHRGDTAEITWIGHRAIDCRRHPDPSTVCPVRVRANAFAPGLPSRDLLLSPDHAVYVRGMLIPIHCLINGGTIRQEIVPDVTYYHVELPGHDIILAEDLPVESYLDTGDRANFSNGGGSVRLFADFSARMWEMAGCAQLVMTGPALEQVKRALARNEPVIAGVGPVSMPRLPVSNRNTYY